MGAGMTPHQRCERARCWNRNEALLWTSWNPFLSSKLPQSLGPFSIINLSDLTLQIPCAGSISKVTERLVGTLPGLRLQGAEPPVEATSPCSPFALLSPSCLTPKVLPSSLRACSGLLGQALFWLPSDLEAG